jgi:8-amino-7-oxononanoate synthase
MDRVISPTEAIIGGKKIITIGTHNYLGLSFDPDCINAVVEAVKRDGTGTCGSRVANGSFAEHLELERELADFHGMRHCMVFTTGYQANLGVISTLVGKGDFLLIDADSHASIYDACKQTDASVIRFKHNDVGSLSDRLRRLKDESGNKLVVVEGIYSMLGDIAPLKEMLEVTKHYGAYMIVDEAHSMGVLGPRGCGLAEDLGVLDQVDFVIGTFSKTLGAVGGYCISNHDDFDALRVTCRPYMFSASLPSATISGVRAALRAVTEQPELRQKLTENFHTLYETLQANDLFLGPTPSPIVAVRLKNSEMAIAAWRTLLHRGYYVNIGLPPATPNNEALLRCAVSAAHSSEQMQSLAGEIVEVVREVERLGHEELAAVN